MTVAADDLNTPLGRAREPRRKRRTPDPFTPLAIVFLAIMVAITGWIVLTDDPIGGEPVARVAIARAQPPAPTGEIPADTGLAPPSPSAAIPEVDTASGPLIIKVPRADMGGVMAEEDPALAETSRHGTLPRIADDGQRPMDVYARAVTASTARPRIAVVVTGLGVSASITEQALAALPADITLAFIPYGTRLGEIAAGARQRGHEILLQIPMEPFDYPNNDPGPQALLTNLPASANIERMRWSMSRMHAYAGMVPYMGARFAQSGEALAPILAEAARRGLFFVNDNARSGAFESAAQAAGILAAPATISPAPGAGAEELDAALRGLEEKARSSGAAIAVVPAQPAFIARLQNWAGGLSERGITLVPVSDIIKRPASAETQRKSPS